MQCTPNVPISSADDSIYVCSNGEYRSAAAHIFSDNPQPCAGKTPFKDFSAGLSIKELNLPQCSDRLFGRFNNESRQSGIDNFWNRTCPIRNDWRATRHGFYHHESKRLWPID